MKKVRLSDVHDHVSRIADETVPETASETASETAPETETTPEITPETKRQQSGPQVPIAGAVQSAATPPTQSQYGGPGEPTGPTFSIGLAISQCLGIYFANFASFNAVAALAVLPTILLSLLFYGDLSLLADDTASVDNLRLYGVTVGVNLVFVQIAQGAIVFGAINFLSGTPVGSAAMLQKSFNILVPLIGVSLLTLLACGVGFMVFVIPGVIIAVMLIAAIPALVMENLGIMDAMERSQELTKGNRWLIFWTYVVFFLGISVFFVAASFLIEAINAFTGGFNALTLLLYAYMDMVGTALGGTMLAAVYMQLRIIREGMPGDEIAKVFA